MPGLLTSLRRARSLLDGARLVVLWNRRLERCRNISLIFLACATLFLPAFALIVHFRSLCSSLFPNPCRKVALPHAHFVTTLHSAAALSQPDAAHPNTRIHGALSRSRAASTAFLTRSNFCPFPQRLDLDRVSLEFAIASNPSLDGVLLYIFGVLGSKSHTVIEIDAGTGSETWHAGAALALYAGWDLLGLYETWSGYIGAHRLYYSRQASALRKARFPDARVRLAEASLLPEGIAALLAEAGFGGDIDLLLLGSEDVFSVWEAVMAGAAPRVVVLSYQDFWGSKLMAMKRGNRTRGCIVNFLGASIAAAVAEGKKRGYGLVWCLKSAPIAIFAVEREVEGLLPVLDEGKCLSVRAGSGVNWRRDMEALWEDAQRCQ